MWEVDNTDKTVSRYFSGDGVRNAEHQQGVKAQVAYVCKT
jgi:hypothetical protein